MFLKLSWCSIKIYLINDHLLYFFILNTTMRSCNLWFDYFCVSFNTVHWCKHRVKGGMPTSWLCVPGLQRVMELAQELDVHLRGRDSGALEHSGRALRLLGAQRVKRHENKCGKVKYLLNKERPLHSGEQRSFR